MKKNTLFLVAIIAVSAALFSSCGNYGTCHWNHFINPYPRNNKDFSSDTLTIEQLAEKYNDLVDGDTITVRGIIDSKRLTWGPYRYPNNTMSMYLHNNSHPDNSGLQPSPRGWGKIQFITEWELWLDTLDGMGSIPSGTYIVTNGIIHFYHDGTGTDVGGDSRYDGNCYEKSYLKVLSYLIEERGKE